MNIENPILTETKELNVDGLELILEATTYKEPIWKTGELVYNMAVIRRKDNKQVWGLGYAYDNAPMEKEELLVWMERLSNDPKAIKAPFS